MSENGHREEQEQLLEKLSKRLTMAAFSRRSMMASSAGAAVAIGIGARTAGAQSTPAASPATEAGGPTTDEEQIFYSSALQNDPSSFDFNADLYCGAEVETWAGLLTFDADGIAIPDWAETFSSNDDASVWTFNIRPDNTGWSNGDPVTADDFIWSFTRLLDPLTANVYSFILFDILNGESFGTSGGATADQLGLVAIDQWTLEITLEGPRGNFPQKLAYTACVPSHRPSVEEYGADWALGEVPLVSSGPFKLDQWDKGVKAVLSRNENYWDAANIHLTALIDPIIPASNQVNNFENGTGDQQLDWCTLGAADYVRFRDDPALAPSLRQYIYPGIWMMLPSNGVAPFDTLEVRQALSHAIDRERLVTVTEGLVQPAACMVPQGVYGFFQDPAIDEIQAYDPELAISMLAGTPYEGGANWPEITVLMRGEEEIFNSDVMINDIVAQLQENLNMEVNIVSLTEQAFRDRLYSNADQLVWIRWWYDYPDPDNGYFDMFYGQKAAGTKRQAWSNPEFDTIVTEAKAVLDPEARLELYKQAETIIQTDVGYIPVVFRLDVYAFKPWVKGITVNSQGFTVPDGNIFVRANTRYFIEGRE
ncbi:MAG: ABC transporter substrate-binding protein [Thermomicrobiales bacterium]